MPSGPLIPPAQYPYIVRTPDVLGGEARIDGHRIRVRDIVAARDLGASTPEEIVANAYPSLTLAQVYSALAYYEDHRAEVDAAWDEDLRRAEEFRKNQPAATVGIGQTTRRRGRTS